MSGTPKDPKKDDKSEKKTTENEDLSLDQLDEISGGLARRITKSVECTTGLLSTCKDVQTINTTSCCS